MTQRVDESALINAFLGTARGGEPPVDPMANSYEFVNEYNLTLDGVEFDWQKYKHLVPVYEDDWRFMVLMAGAQTGKTGRLMTHLGRTAFGAGWGGLLGYYFPDFFLPKAFSRQRFDPFIRGNPALAKHLGAERLKGTKGTDNVLTKTLGETTIFFLSTRGISSTEGLPLGACYFDEVRKMEAGDIERAQERYSAQGKPIDWKVSTARYPESDIHSYFLESDQRFFHTACSCPNGCVLSLRYPDCIMDLRSVTPKQQAKVAHAFSHAGVPYLGMDAEERVQFVDACYYCPTCGDIITDPRDGWWEPHGVGFAHGYQMPQLLSWTYPAGRVLHKHETARDLQEFYNSTIGLPFLDETKRPVKPEHLAACVNKDLRWYAKQPVSWRKRRVKNLAMGVDIQAGYHVAVIKALAENGKHRTVHLQIVENDEKGPWYELGVLMHDWDVRLAVIDQAPDWSEAMRFAQHWLGRVFLANYTDSIGGDMVSWGDRNLKKSQRGKEIKFRHRVNIDKVRGLKWSLGRWVQRTNEIPDPRTLIQVLPRDGKGAVLSPFLRVGTRAPSAICAELYFDHLQRMIFRDEYEDDDAKAKQMKTRIVAEYIGHDPHFAHADLYASVAMARLGRPARVKRP